ncbi:hypothetical protein CPB83DRAFT_854283 [Crepidotus variabilis]|uniref:SAM domain-containing protein n=1 Tax=Crepidotus variabilis TaxID=179855 RepID=A0A9P6EFC8_9AGAR|nr:hypothetical protein CPB83DRAFT_854283 [Crepidotus variabilis]
MSNIESLSSVASADAQVAPASGKADGASTPQPNTVQSTQDFQSFLKDFRKYESVIELMQKAAGDNKFKEELATIEQWFKVLNEPERNAAINSLVQHSTQDQLRFFQSLISSMIKPEEPKATPVAQEKPKLGKLSFRPPSLNLPDLGSPVTPTPVTAKESATDEQSHDHHLSQALRQADASEAPAAKDASTNPLPGFSGINPYTLNMLANAGLSKDAQLLAAQLVMSGLVQPTGILQQPSAKPKNKPLGSANWRTPASARFPASALRSSGLRPSSGLKSAGLKSSGLNAPQTPMTAGLDSPRVEEFSPDMLKDIPGWLRSLRLHKYTQCFDGLTWQQMVVLDDAALETRGIAALGARRRLLRTFEHVRKEMGIEEPEEPNSATPTTSAMPTGAFNKPAEQPHGAPHSALPRSKLSINSPIFTPTWESSKTPQSAAPTMEATAPAVTELVAAAATAE